MMDLLLTAYCRLYHGMVWYYHHQDLKLEKLIRNSLVGGEHSSHMFIFSKT